jgi:RHS repeat-associated protein
MLRRDPQVTTIDLSASLPMQAARGSVVRDSDGERQAMVLFPQGTQAQMVLPDGTLQPLTSLHVRATEFTVGDKGPEAMPGALPATSAYTYAVELSVDEAVAAGAKEVRFSEPVPFYLDNFVGFPVGTPVPVGYYDYDKAQWVPSVDGRVIAILSVSGGLATIDASGNGQAATAEQLSALGITDAERTRLAELYGPGKSLWRAQLPHFSTIDCNWAADLPPGAIPPLATNPTTGSSNNPDCSSTQAGCVIEAEKQVLGETIPITGTPFTLNFRSDRQVDYSPSRVVNIPISGPTIPAAVDKINLDITIAGQLHHRTFSKEPNQTTTFVWDGRDAWGRPVVGNALLEYDISYVYRAVYAVPGGAPRSFSRVGSGVQVSGDRATNLISLSRRNSVALTGVRPDNDGLGGLNLDVHHHHVSAEATLYRGDGTREKETLIDIASTVAGTGARGKFVEGAPASQSPLESPYMLKTGPDGSLYITHTASAASPITRVSPDGTMRTLAPGAFNHSHDLAFGVDGSIYVADDGSFRVLRLDPDGTVTTVAGTGTAGSSGDGGPAVNARIYAQSVAVGRDGAVYIGEPGRVRRVGTDGIISTFAGTGVVGAMGDDGPATRSRINAPNRIMPAPDGSIYLCDVDRIRRVDTSGIITTVAGGGTQTGDGITARAASIQARGCALAEDGSIYFAERSRVRRLHSTGILTTIAGTGSDGFSGDGGAAKEATFQATNSVAISPRGTLYIADGNNYRIRAITGSVKVTGFGDQVPSRDGTEYYSFSSGRHRRTVDALTGALRYKFGYGPKGYLETIEDGDGNVTTIERSPATGAPEAIISPYGQRTRLRLDPNGYLAAVTNPAHEAFEMNYTSGGLLTRFKKPAGGENSYGYDSLGRLKSDQDPLGGGWDLTRPHETLTGFTTSMKSAEGRVTRYDIERPDEETLIHTVTSPDGTESTSTTVTRDKTISATSQTADGTRSTKHLVPDPRAGLASPYVDSAATTTPRGLVNTYSALRNVALSNPADPFSITTLVESADTNGRVTTSTYAGPDRRWSELTPEGRVETLTLDTRGRPVLFQFADLEPLQYEYDERGRLKSLTQGSGTEARTTLLAYDPQGYLQSVTDPLHRSVSFEYDPAGRVSKQSFPDRRSVLYSYDANGNLASLTPPGRMAHLFQYTPVDLEENYTPPTLDGVDTITRYTYNRDKQLTRIDRPDGLTVGIDYEEPSGRMQAVNFSRGQIGYSYHPTTGRLQSITAPGQSLSYTWDGFLPLSETATGEVSGTVSRTYDNNFWVKSIAVNGQAVAYEYDKDGLVTKAGDMTITRDPQNGLITDTALGVVTTHREYTTFGELKSEVASVNGAPVFSTSYLRDALGRITEKTETIEGVTTTYGYHYDDSGRLDEVKTNGTVTARYRYDENGNRLSKWTPDGEETGTYDAQDRMVTYGGASYEYTANGELKSKTENGATTHYTYDEMGNLVQVELPGGVVIDYVIDGRNRRVGKKVDGKFVQGFLYDGQLAPLAALDENGRVVMTAVYGPEQGVIVYFSKGHRTYRVISESQNIRLTIDATTGEIAQRITYDDFGRAILNTNPSLQPYAFAGAVLDQDTGLYRVGGRDYSPTEARWLAKDPSLFSGGDENLYTYVTSDPVNYFDPDGEAKVGKNKKYQKPENPNRRKGAEERTKTGERERNVGHPEGEEHSRRPKGGFRLRIPRMPIIDPCIFDPILCNPEFAGEGDQCDA